MRKKYEYEMLDHTLDLINPTVESKLINIQIETSFELNEFRVIFNKD
jgi:hypothetical protein